MSDEQDFEDLLSVDSDEMEGQQAIDLKKLNFCNPDLDKIDDFPLPYGPKTISDIQSIINGDDIKSLLGGDVFNIPKDASFGDVSTYDGDIENYAIIEFGQDCTNSDAVDYTILVKPNEHIDNNTILANITQDGQQKEIRSIFDSGTIMADEQGDFFHLFPSHTSRHIVIKNYTCGSGCDLKQGDIEEFNEKFKNNSELYTLIKDNYVYASLPQILQNRESEDEHYIIDPILNIKVDHSTLGLCKYENGHSIYNKYISKFEERMKDYADDIQSLSSGDNVKNTKGNPEKTQALYAEIQAKREEVLSYVISYRNSATTLDKCQYSDIFSDCRFLAWGLSNDNGEISTNDFKANKVGSMVYGNYYGDLLSRIYMMSDNTWSKKYYELISDIINTRLSLEKYSQSSLIKEFDALYKININHSDNNGYSSVSQNVKPDASYGDIYNYIYAQVPNEDQDYKTSGISQQLANIYTFIKNYNDDNDLQASDAYLDSDGNIDIMKLVQDEENKLEAFWGDAINEYYTNTLVSLVSELQDYANSMMRYAEYPAPLEIPIEGVNYKIYTFQNKSKLKEDFNEEEGDYDIDLDDIKRPEIPTTVDKPSQEEAQKAFDENLAAKQSDNDPNGSEPTIVDLKYWQKYFAMATLVNCIPAYWSDGFDVPPEMTPTPMPAIFICFGCVYMKQINAVLVLGIGIRGIWVAPILMVVNLSSRPISGLTPLVMILENVKNLFNTKIRKIEMCVPNMVQLMIDKLKSENVEYKKTNMKYDVYIDTLKQMRSQLGSQIKKDIDKILHPNADHRQVITRVEKLT